MFGLKVDRNSSFSITSQLTRQIRDTILCGRITAREKMPPSRVLARELGVSRNTIIQAYEQLLAEGYLESRVGLGTFVADIGSLPEVKTRSPYIEREQEIKDKSGVIAFYAGNPDISAFPRAVWAKALKEACLDADESDFGYGGGRGHRELRQALADYLYRAKGMYCSSDSIFIVPGMAPGIEVLSRLMCAGSGCAAVEAPCLDFIRSAFTRGGAKIISVESDGNGMRTELLPRDANVRLIYTSPSHQYPLGGVLPAARRLSLLEYAQTHDAYIIEDDYDSEFRYPGEPIQSLWSLNGERVIYLGSFSNVFYPSLRMAYMIVPHGIAKELKGLLAELNIWAGTIQQIALAKLIESKQFDRHIYKMRRLYDAKRRVLIACLRDSFGQSIKISGERAGLHMLVTFDREITDEDKKAISAAGVEVDYAEDYAVIKDRHKKSIVMGYGNLDRAQIEEGVKRLKAAFDKTLVLK